MLAIDDVVSVGSEFRATLRVANIGPVGWRTPATGDATPAPLLFSHSMPHRSVELDYGRAFLDKHIAPRQYCNLEPVGYYSRYLEHNRLAWRVTLGAQLWDSAMQVPEITKLTER